MAHDERYERERERGRGPGWRGDDSFGGGWGNQTARPQRLGDRGRRPYDDPDYGAERYGSGATTGYGADYGLTSEPESYAIAPGYDPSFAGPRFDRLDVGSTGTHGVHSLSSPFGGAYVTGGGITPGGGYVSSARTFAEIGRQGHRDPHYAAWRSRQIDALDRDYEEYRRENQARFDRSSALGASAAASSARPSAASPSIWRWSAPTTPIRHRRRHPRRQYHPDPERPNAGGVLTASLRLGRQRRRQGEAHSPAADAMDRRGKGPKSRPVRTGTRDARPAHPQPQLAGTYRDRDQTRRRLKIYLEVGKGLAARSAGPFL